MMNNEIQNEETQNEAIQNEAAEQEPETVLEGADDSAEMSDQSDGAGTSDEADQPEPEPPTAEEEPAKKAEKALAPKEKTDPVVVIKRVPREQTESAAAQESNGKSRGRRKVRVGRVVSDKMDKTVVVAVQRNMRHPLYGKIVRRTKKYKAHDEQNDCHVGDMVEIIETRPISREKRWRVRSVVERAK